MDGLKIKRTFQQEVNGGQLKDVPGSTLPEFPELFHE
jgi:hypothetical protein